MNREKVAEELLKVAKDLVGADVVANDYRFLDRMRQDLDYVLNESNPGYGLDGAEKHLYMSSFEKQIKEMKKLWNRLDEKPEWLTKRDIADYEKRIKKLRRFKSGSERVASIDILEDLVPQRDIAKLRKSVDEVTYELAVDVYKELMKRMKLANDTEDALNRLRNAISSSNEGMIRNNVFKAANSLGMKLPHHAF